MKKKYPLFFIIIFILTFLTSCNSARNVFNKNYDILKIHYINVGQGDSILIQVNNTNTLIDSGDPKHISTLLSYLKKTKIGTLDYLIATHPHDDHIGGMYDIISAFKINSFYAPKVLSSTDCFKYMVYALKKKNLKINTIISNKKISMGEHITAQFLAPNSFHYKKLNNFSAVLKLTYKNVSFLFCGDAENLSESEMLNNNKQNLKSTVIKIGHHGAKTSTSNAFLNAVSPKIAVISCGKRNKFGHPHIETLNKLKNRECIIYRTDLDGNILLISDGYKIIKK